MANDEIKNGHPHNQTGTSKGGNGDTPIAESQLDSAMKTQHTDSLITDGVKDKVHHDSTGNTPKGHPTLAGTEYPVFDGTLHEQSVGGTSGVKQDYRVG